MSDNKRYEQYYVVFKLTLKLPSYAFYLLKMFSEAAHNTSQAHRAGLASQVSAEVVVPQPYLLCVSYLQLQYIII